MNHIMVDLETLGTGNNAAILSIGAVRFDPYYMTEFEVDNIAKENKFYRNINLTSCANLGMQVDDGAFRFWLSQPDEARTALSSPKAQPILDVLREFREWLEWDEKSLTHQIWANPPSFDLTILSNAFRLTKGREPWGHRQERDFREFYRTYQYLSGDQRKYYELVTQTGRHNALYDAHRQSLAVQVVHDFYKKELKR